MQNDAIVNSQRNEEGLTQCLGYRWMPSGSEYGWSKLDDEESPNLGESAEHIFDSQA